MKIVLNFALVIFIFSSSILATENMKEKIEQDLNLFYSSFTTQETYQNRGAFDYTFQNEKTLEVKLRGESIKGNDSGRYSFGINADFDYKKFISQFIFLEYSKNSVFNRQYSRLGAGIAWLIPYFDDRDRFPYEHKLSIAAISETDYDFYGSGRYKFVSKIARMEFKVIYFIFTLGYRLQTKVSCKLDTIVSIVYTTYEKEFNKNKYNESSLGLSLNLL